MIFGSFDEVPRGRYGVVYEDPAWKFTTRSAKGSGRPGSAEYHYPTMTLAQIKALPVADVCAKDAHLFMWTTGPHLEQAFEVLRAHGFKYSTMAFVWVKLTRSHAGQPALFYDLEKSFHVGRGYTTMSNVEFCLLGRRGKPPRIGRGIRQLCLAPVREHSRKPDEIRTRIERYAGDQVPRLEMNARQAFPGWDAWGNEVDTFAPVKRGRVILPSHGGRS